MALASAGQSATAGVARTNSREIADRGQRHDWTVRRPSASSSGRPSEFGERFCVTSSMADGVLAHLVSRVAPGVDVVFLDTGLHFPQTLRVRDEVAAHDAGAGALDHAAADRRPAGRRARSAAVRPRPRRLLRAAQGRAAGAGAGRRTTPGPPGVRRDETAVPGEHAGGRLRRRAAARSRSPRWPAGPTPTWTPTSSGTTCR